VFVLYHYIRAGVGEYHKYDVMIYPKRDTIPGVGDRVKQKKIGDYLRLPSKQFTTKGSDDHIISGPHTQSAHEISKFCFGWYLKLYTNKICKGCFSPSDFLYRLKDDICVLYSTIFNYLLIKNDEVVTANEGKGIGGQQVCVFCLTLLCLSYNIM
jgi:hypothetical protein